MTNFKPQLYTTQLTLLTSAMLEKLTENSLGIDAKGNLLDDGVFHRQRSFFSSHLGGQLLALPLSLFGFLALLLGGFGAGRLGLDLFDLFLGDSSFFLHFGEKVNEAGEVDCSCGGGTRG